MDISMSQWLTKNDVPASQTVTRNRRASGQQPPTGAPASTTKAETIATQEAEAENYYQLGLQYEDGDRVPQNYAGARNWYRKAADMGHAEAQVRLGYLYIAGAGGDENEREAAKWFIRAAEQGLAMAQYIAGTLYFEGEAGVPENKTLGRELYLKAAKQGVADASFSLGMEYHLLQKDYKNSYIWFDVAAAQEGLTLGYEGALENRDRAAAKLDPATLTEARQLALEYRRAYAEPFQ